MTERTGHHDDAARDETTHAPARTTGNPRLAVALLRVTIIYNLVEGVVAVGAGAASGLLSLVGFGVDSGIEVAAAGIVLHRLRRELRHGDVDEEGERRALRAVAVTFFALAAYVTFEGVRALFAADQPDTSTVGTLLVALSLLVMPLLAHAKRRNGERMGNRLVLADATETKLCAWLSVSTLAGLVAYTVVGWTWIDPVAGFVIAAFAVNEGREAWEGELAHDH